VLHVLLVKAMQVDVVPAALVLAGTRISVRVQNTITCEASRIFDEL